MISRICHSRGRPVLAGGDMNGAMISHSAGQVASITQVIAAMLPPGGRRPHEALQTGFDNRLESHLNPVIHPKTEFQDSLLAASVTFSPRGSGTAACDRSGMRRVVHKHDLTFLSTGGSDNQHPRRRCFLETEDHTPVRPHRDCPEARRLALESVQPEAGQVHILGCGEPFSRARMCRITLR
ncbi:hypothetical protein [Nisaea sp.]|uniref:hypothetical protein n=1 Tax=Nisaea sp. TaxID=2024842 RepID=UPI003B5212E9